MRELEHLGIELAGRNLIEASAGTGKTYAIACLYLRLIVESGLMPEQILVVTYTEAATEELRGRIRSRIREALNLFAGTPSRDPFLCGLLSNDNGRGPGREEAVERLDRALKSFDLAAISTIHGFCLRALQDNAFESGSLYDTELLPDGSALLQEVVDDFWRRTFFAKPAPLLGHALAQGLTPATFAGFLRGMLGNPKLRVLPAFEPAEVAALEAECRVAYDAVVRMWGERGEEIQNLLSTDKGLSRNANGWYHPAGLPALFEALGDYTACGNPFDLFGDFVAFCASSVLDAKKKTGAPLQDPFFELCEDLQESVSSRFLALKSELIVFAAGKLPARKKELNVRCFDDLLTGLYEALRGPQGEALACCLRLKYRAALIDEFQDTDPVQFDIFRKIYADPAQPLFLIGDPKQAIYSFRGADIFAYLAAADDVEPGRRFTLTHNWRSTPKLLDAFNAVFDGSFHPFLFDEIAFHPVSAGCKEGGAELTLSGGDDGAALQLWCLPQNDAGKSLNMGQAGELVCAAVAAETARLLQEGREGRALIDGRPVLPEDVAIIVRSHLQAANIQRALNDLSIPSVMRSDESIMETAEAREVGILIGALAAPGNEPKIRAALVTDLIGLTGNDIAHLQRDETIWEEWLARFREYHTSWMERGFMVMIQVLMSREGVRGRLLGYPDGERRLTNLLHCFEVLHKASLERGLGAEGLSIWFGERLSGGEGGDEYQIRLETDEKAVKILTIHISKGLEFPIVFCPFLFGGVRTGDEVVSFHDDFTLVKDFGSPDQDRHRVLAQKEALAEDLRLLYVALTRAKFRCYLVAGKLDGSRAKNKPETSALSYLFHASEATRTAVDPVGALAEEVKALPATEMLGQLAGVAERAGGGMCVTVMPEIVEAEPLPPAVDPGGKLSPRKFVGVIERDWRVASFTSLAAHDGAAVELPDRDRVQVTEAPLVVAAVGEPGEGSIFNFPKGSRAGLFLHDIFEKYDFAETPAGGTAELVQAALVKHGFPPEWQDAVCDLVGRVVTTPFSSADGPFTLSDLQPGKWLSEFEFFFPLKFVTPELLKKCLGAHAGEASAADLTSLAAALKFRDARGMLMGFMDLVFEHGGRYYLLDWKSNHLGNRVEAYGVEALRDAMARNMYTLQYLIYTTALNRYLSLRVPGYRYETHFGGVLYLFLRGMDPARGEEFGVFRDTPSPELIDALTNCLIQAGG